MLFTHPKILLLKTNPFKLLGFIFKKPNFVWLKNELAKYFPNKHFLFTKTGIQAFEIIVEKYSLQNSTMALPAFICNTFYPILKKHNIKPFLIDSEKNSFNISLFDLKAKLSRAPNIQAVVVCHTFGKTVDITPIKQMFAGLIIEDLSHAFKMHPQADIAFMSLAKQFPVLHGGLLISNQPIKRNRSLGSFNLNVFAYFLQAFTANLEKRNTNVILLKEKLKNIPAILLQNYPTYFTILLPKNRDAIYNALKKQGIKAGRVWQNPLVFNYKEQIANNPNAISFSKQVLQLPLQPYFKEKHLSKIANSLKLILQKIGA